MDQTTETKPSVSDAGLEPAFRQVTGKITGVGYGSVSGGAAVPGAFIDLSAPQDGVSSVFVPLSGIAGKNQVMGWHLEERSALDLIGVRVEGEREDRGAEDGEEPGKPAMRLTGWRVRPQPR